ncbi:unnamed protein product [Cyprideis torosa]|uniref:Uncharacterized protein n=1 Tax=Cyprideis torosa TaxID=163714 RepID=A0A7R8W1V0_9CRUS|nr:unnamed protein product [Cyprideis torosa]CAG0881324.1 unnamed protein product [Cyprideis torosa]
MAALPKVALSLLLVIYSVQARLYPRSLYPPKFFENDKEMQIRFPSNDIFDDRDDGPCENVMCDSNGEECAVNRQGKGECVCIKSCPEHYNPVCGTDGFLYPNHCELHRTACVTGYHISIQHEASCIPKPVDESTTTAVPHNHLSEEAFPSPIHLETNLEEKGKRVEPTTTEPQQTCQPAQLEVLKENLILLNYDRLQPVKLVDLVPKMFSRYDLNQDEMLSDFELEEAHRVDQPPPSYLNSPTCTMKEILGSGHISYATFAKAFGNVNDVTTASREPVLETSTVQINIGDSVNLQCDVVNQAHRKSDGEANRPVVWRRNGVDLKSLDLENMEFFQDGALYISDVQLFHSGRYTCNDDDDESIVQTHFLNITSVPRVSTIPSIQAVTPGSSALMECWVTGQPNPQVIWLKNDAALSDGSDMETEKFDIRGNGRFLRIQDLTYSDTGAYMCQGTSPGGLQRGVSSLIVQDHPRETLQQVTKSVLVILHSHGISFNDPEECQLRNLIRGTEVVPGTQMHICGETETEGCVWGSAVNVNNTYVFVTQPFKDRIIVISLSQRHVVDVIKTDSTPVSLQYSRHHDQVWVVCWRHLSGDLGHKTLQVVRHASHRGIQRLAVHPEPISGEFDTRARYPGVPMTSPDSNWLVTLHHHDKSIVLGVQQVTADGLRFEFDVETTLNVSDVTFARSNNRHSYDILASSWERPDILHLDLSTGHVDIITGVGEGSQNPSWWNIPLRPIASAPGFSPYFATTSDRAVFIGNAQSRSIHCEIGNLEGPQRLAWFTEDVQNNGIVNDYDAVAIQEIRDIDESALQVFLDALNYESEFMYTNVSSPRLGRTSYKEQYALVYKPSSIQVLETYVYEDEAEDIFEREPFAMKVVSNLSDEPPFALIVVHMKPDDAVAELDKMPDVIDIVMERFAVEDMLLVGDFNSDCSYVTDSDWDLISLWTQDRFTWLVDNDEDTTVRESTNCAYDRMVSLGTALEATIEDVTVRRFNAPDDLNIHSESDAIRISDHYPVDIMLGF